MKGQPAKTETITANGASNSNLSYALKIDEIGQSYFQESGALGRRYNKVSKSTLYEEFLKVSGANEDKWSEYQFYKEYPSVPDFGAFYGMELKEVSKGGGTYQRHTTSSGNQMIDNFWMGLDPIFEELDKNTSPYTAYIYSYDDFVRKHGIFYKEYTELLKECGFQEEYLQSVKGDYQFYYNKGNLSVRIYTTDYNQYPAYRYSKHLNWEEMITVQIFEG